jgi:glycosyltransferase involved in cell wall biosynthesis
MRKIAFWGPLPPQASGTADYGYALLAQLRQYFDITAIVDDRMLHEGRPVEPSAWRVPDGVDALGASRYDPGAFDCDVYQMGNHPRFHGYLHAQTLSVPGLLILHDLSLFDLYAGICGSAASEMLLDEIAYNTGAPAKRVPLLWTDSGASVDHLRTLLIRRVVEASLCTVVHSSWAKSLIEERFPAAPVERIFHGAVRLGAPHERRTGLQFGVIGGIGRHKRVLKALKAFELVAPELPGAHLVIAGRVDDPRYLREIESAIAVAQLEHAVDIRTNVSSDDLEALLRASDVVITLRWPTAGETSGIMMRAFGAGTPVITSDIPQFRDFDGEFCWRVPVDETEVVEIAAHLRRVARNPDLARRAGERAQAFVDAEASFSICAEEYARLIDGLADRAGAIPGRLSVNAIGCWPGTTGLTEAARRGVVALTHAGVSVATVDVELGIPQDDRRVPAEIAEARRPARADIDLCFLNINELHGIPDSMTRSRPTNVSIASWYWELPDVPMRLRSEIDRFDEIWVATQFVQDNIGQYTTQPVVVIPPVVRVPEVGTPDRSRFGLSSEATVFLFHFDANSGFARKNPLGVIEAFRRAFSAGQRAHSVSLVIKTMNLWRWPAAEVELRAQLADVGGLLIDEDLAEEDMAVLMASCDAYVSLHRSEGFGLGMAEAMALGKPVIATHYSGNADFIRPTNSCPVRFLLRPLTADDLAWNPGSERLYPYGALWAEPDLDQAASWMREIASSPELRSRIGAAARAYIESHYSEEAAVAAMRPRLELARERAHGRSRQADVPYRASTELAAELA